MLKDEQLIYCFPICTFTATAVNGGIYDETTLNIDFPNSSSDFTSFAYYNFIKEHIEEYNNCCRDGIIEGFGDEDIFWGYEYGLWEY